MINYKVRGRERKGEGSPQPQGKEEGGGGRRGRKEGEEGGEGGEKRRAHLNPKGCRQGGRGLLQVGGRRPCGV